MSKKVNKADDSYRSSMQFENHHRTALQYPLVNRTLCRCQQYGAFNMKALARYQVILLGEQRHIRCEQLAQGCCPNNATVGVEPATSWSRVQRPTATLPTYLNVGPDSLSILFYTFMNSFHALTSLDICVDLTRLTIITVSHL